jgi:hypothetical protein
VLGWFRAELNLAAVSLEELGLETIIKVDFPVQPGDRLLLKVAEVDVRSGFYRMYVHDRLSTYSSGTTDEAATVRGDEGQTEEDLSEEELERLLLLDLAGDGVAVSSEESDEPQGVLRWRSAAPPSSNEEDEEDTDDTGLVFGSFTSSDVGSEVLSFDRQHEQQLVVKQQASSEGVLATTACNDLRAHHVH